MIDAIQLNELLPRKKGFCYIPVSPDHLAFMDIDDPGMLAAQEYFSLQDMVRAQIEAGPSATILKHGKPVGVFGIVICWRGVGEMWSIFTPEFRRTPKYMCDAAMQFCDIAAQSLGLHRLQMAVRCSDERAVRWAQFLGFQIEGRMRRYSVDGADTYMMARL